VILGVRALLVEQSISASSWYSNVYKYSQSLIEVLRVIKMQVKVQPAKRLKGNGL